MKWFKRLFQQENPQRETTLPKGEPGMDAEAYFRQGVQLGQAQRTEEALEAFEAAVRLRPSFAQAHYNRAIALYNLKRLEEALAAYDEVIRLKPGEESAAALFERGEVLTRMGRWEDAVTAFDQILVLRPDYPAALGRRAPVLEILGRHQEAARDRDKLRKIQDNKRNEQDKGNLIFIFRNPVPCEHRAELCEDALKEFLAVYPNRWTQRPKVTVDKSTDYASIEMTVAISDMAELDKMRTSFITMLASRGFLLD